MAARPVGTASGSTASGSTASGSTGSLSAGSLSAASGDAGERAGAANAQAANVRVAGGGGAGRARIREAPFGAAPIAQAEAVSPIEAAAPADPGPPGPAAGQHARPVAPRQPWYQVIGPSGQPREHPASLFREMAVAPLVNPAALTKPAVAVNPAAAACPDAARKPWAAQKPDTASKTSAPARDPGQARLSFTPPHPEGHPVPEGDGRVNCGPLEKILWRQWEESAAPHPQAVSAVERLASFPRALQEKLADGLTGIYVGPGGVPDLDHMTGLRGVPLQSGKATWDACAGAYGDRKIVIGTRPSPTPDVMCHEIGHALDDLDSPSGRWQSDSAEFRLIYDQCKLSLASDFHRQRGGLGRKEFFADSFAAIASGQRPALVDMLGGNTRAALRVMLYFNRRYGI